MTERPVLVTGANGLVGCSVVHELSRREVSVVANARQDALRMPPENGCGFESADLCDEGQPEALLAKTKPRVVVHCAAMSQVDRCEEERDDCRRINTDCVERIARWCRSNDARMVHVSTDFVFDGQSGLYDEDAAPGPVNYYGESKLAAERVVAEHGPEDHAIVRTVLVYGDGRGIGRNNILTWVIDSLRAGKTIRVVDDQWRTPTFLGDLTYAIVELVDSDVRGLLHASGPEYVSVFEFARRIAAAFDLDASLIEPVASASLEQPARRPPKTGLVVTKARDGFQYLPANIAESLRRLATELVD